MAKPRNKHLDYLTYLGVRLLIMFIQMFPLRANYRTARLIGNLMYRFDHRHRHRGLEHLRRSFPDWTEQKYHRITKASMRNLVYLGLEVLFTTRLITPVRWRRHVRLKNMAETLRLLVEQSSGLIFLTGHFGNWEVLGYTMAAMGFPSVSVARPLDNPYINDYLMGVRQLKGQDILYKKGATASMDDVLNANGLLGFIADQDAGRKGTFVDFFGRLASTYKSIALLAMRHQVPVIVCYGRRLSEHYRFEIGVQRIIYPAEWARKSDPLKWITQEYTTALEQVIRTAPEQYLWVHRRWKHRPKGEAPGPDGIA